MEQNRCKICGSESLLIFAHTAKCKDCEVLLFYPYPNDDSLLVSTGEGKSWPRKDVLSWYARSSFYNHMNFTHMLRFIMSEQDKNKSINVLDYGGGGGQFALVCKSHFPEATTYITDISDESLMDEWSPLNTQILFKDFAQDETKFDFIFLNDVFEHVSDPIFTLRQLAGKLKKEGKILIDTPKQFWIYPFTKFLSKSLYTKVLKGTVSKAHLQIWSTKSFEIVARESGLTIVKYQKSSEYTMPPGYYLRNMRITNPVVRMAGAFFYKNAKWLAENKILAVLSKQS